MDVEVVEELASRLAPVVIEEDAKKEDGIVETLDVSPAEVSIGDPTDPELDA